MTEQTWWLVGVAAVLAAAVIGFLLGRSKFGGAHKRVEALEAEVLRQKEELSGYRREVEFHFDKTASLVASMAGSYKDLFEHLSSGYEQLSSGSARQLFKDRVVGQLVGTAAGVAAGVAAADELASEPAEVGEATEEPVTDAADAAAEPAPAADAGEAETSDAVTAREAATAAADEAVPARESAATGDDAGSEPLPATTSAEDEPRPSPEGQEEAAEKSRPPA